MSNLKFLFQIIHISEVILFGKQYNIKIGYELKTGKVNHKIRLLPQLSIFHFRLHWSK